MAGRTRSAVYAVSDGIMGAPPIIIADPLNSTTSRPRPVTNRSSKRPSTKGSVRSRPSTNQSAKRPSTRSSKTSARSRDSAATCSAVSWYDLNEETSTMLGYQHSFSAYDREYNTDKLWDAIYNDDFFQTNTRNFWETKSWQEKEDKEKNSKFWNAGSGANNNLQPSVYGLNSRNNGHKPQYSPRRGNSSTPRTGNFQRVVSAPVQMERSMPPKAKRAEDLPVHLRILFPHITRDVDETLIGVSPTECFVFLPSLEYYSDLETVRFGDDEDDNDATTLVSQSSRTEGSNMKLDLSKLHSIEIEKDKINKQAAILRRNTVRPVTSVRQHLDHHTCTHGAKDPSKTPRITIYSDSGEILHQTIADKRTSATIRREINELDSILKGKSQAGYIIVQFQQNPESKDSDGEPDTCSHTPNVDPDRQEIQMLRMSTNLQEWNSRSHYSEKNEVMQRIRQQKRLCLLELSEVERKQRRDHKRLKSGVF